MPNYLKNSCKVQVSTWKRTTVITLVSITLKQMPHSEIRSCKSRNLKLKNPPKEYTDQQENEKKKLMALFELLKFKPKDMTNYPEDNMKAKTTRTYSLFFSAKENSKCFFILTWSTLLDLAAVPDEFSLLPVFLNKQILPTYQYLKKTLKVWVGKQWLRTFLCLTSEATLLKGESNWKATEVPHYLKWQRRSQHVFLILHKLMGNGFSKWRTHPLVSFLCLFLHM